MDHRGLALPGVILDLYSRRVIGWAMGHRLTVELAEQARTMALANQNPLAGLLHHSDRGSQYAATRYQLLLTTHGITTSMLRRGNCWDNAWVERFFGTLKRERVSPRHDATRDDAIRDIVEYREVFSNRQRRHSTLGDHFPGRVRSEDGRGVTRCLRNWERSDIHTSHGRDCIPRPDLHRYGKTGVFGCNRNGSSRRQCCIDSRDGKVVW